MAKLAFLVAASAAIGVAAVPPPTDPVAEYARVRLGVTDYERADADLNGDGRAETFLYVTDQSRCGSGGCSLFVVSPEKGRLRVVMSTTVSQRPVWLLATSTHGWRDIGVTVAGGGITEPYTARLQFDGRKYPSNPTVAPAIRLKRPSGEVLIDKP